MLSIRIITCFAIVLLLLVLLMHSKQFNKTALTEHYFVNVSEGWIPMTCKFDDSVTRITIADEDNFASLNDESAACHSTPDPGRFKVTEGEKHAIDFDMHARYLDRAFATCDKESQVMSGFKVNTEGVGTEQGTIQASAMCSTDLSHRRRNTKTYYTPYRNANLGASVHEADCKGKALVAIGFETDQDDDDNLRMRYDCAYDVETFPASSQTYYTGWYGRGNTVDSLDMHTVKCPNEKFAISKIKYYICPHTQEMTAVYDCVPYTDDPISIDDNHYKADPYVPPGAILTEDVTADLQFEDEFRRMFSPIGKNIAGTAKSIGDIGKHVGEGIVKVGKGMGQLFKGVGNGFVGAGNNLGKNVKSSGKQFVNQDIGSIRNAAISFPKVVKSRAVESYKKNIENEIESIKAIGPNISNKADRFGKKIKQTFSALGSGIPYAFTKFGDTSEECWKKVGDAWRI